MKKKDLGYDFECNSFLHMDDKSVESEKATVHFFSLSKPSHFTRIEFFGKLKW